MAFLKVGDWEELATGKATGLPRWFCQLGNSSVLFDKGTHCQCVSVLVLCGKVLGGGVYRGDFCN